MARIAGVDLPKNKHGIIGLTYIYGIGQSTSRRILAEAKIDENTRFLYGELPSNPQQGFFDIADFISSNILLPVGGIGIAVVLAWRWKRSDVADELAKNGVGKRWYQDAVYLAIKLVAPVAIIVVLLNGLGLFGA